MNRELLSERYGKQAGTRPRWMRSRLTRYAVVLIVLLAGVLVAFIGYQNLGSDPISSEVKSFGTSDPNHMRLTFTVTRDQPEKAVDCVVTANLQDATELGRREVLIPAGSSSRTVTTSITTGSKAASAKVYGCSYDVPAYLTATPPVR